VRPFDLERTARNVAAIVSYAAQRGELVDGGGYFQALDALQWRAPVLSLSGARRELEVVFTFDSAARRSLHDVLVKSSELPAGAHVAPFDPQRRAGVCAAIGDALSLLRDTSPEVHALVTTVVSLVIVVDVEHVASASFAAALGVVWLNPPPTWSVLDYAEHLVHEACHQDILLDEMVSGLFRESRRDMRSDARANVESAIRRVPRTFPHAFHAAGVGVHLVWLFQKLARPARARALLPGLERALAELEGKREYLTPVGQERLARFRACLSSYGVELGR
jgi:hypothetical protein